MSSKTYNQERLTSTFSLIIYVHTVSITMYFFDTLRVIGILAWTNCYRETIEIANPSPRFYQKKCLFGLFHSETGVEPDLDRTLSPFFIVNFKK